MAKKTRLYTYLSDQKHEDFERFLFVFQDIFRHMVNILRLFDALLGKIRVKLGRVKIYIFNAVFAD